MMSKNLRLCPLAMIADSINSYGDSLEDRMSYGDSLEDRMGCMYMDCAWYVKTHDACAVTLLSKAAARATMKDTDDQEGGERND